MYICKLFAQRKMSKSKLRKEIATMSHEQLEQIILDAYDARSEIKEYFEFFLNPDIEKLMEKHKKNVYKELMRTKWGTSKARVSVIKQSVKNFIGLNPGVDAVLDMLFMTLEMMCLTERLVDLTPTQDRYITALVHQILKIADSHEIVAQTMERLQNFVSKGAYTTKIKRLLRESIETYAA